MRQYFLVATAALLLASACARAPTRAEAPTPASMLRPAEPPIDSVPQIQAAEARPPIAPAPPRGIDLTQFELPIQYNERVQAYIDLFANRRRAVFTTWLGRMSRYRQHVEEQLQARGLPRELVYLPLIESAYDGNAASRAGAVGLWQFMKGTARAEGLEVSEYVDERRDPYRSTDAALQHLQGLYRHFGSWYLVAAAYNSGSGRIARLLREYGYEKGRDEAFWALQDELPRETRDYVPMLLAAAIIGENADRFGITIAPEPPVRFTMVRVPAATELRAIARAAGASLEQIELLNAHFTKGVTPPDRASEVRVPRAAEAGFAEAFARIPAAERTRAATSSHVVKRGETLSGIARRYGTTVEAISRVNGIERPNAIAAGRKLIIPGGA